MPDTAVLTIGEVINRLRDEFPDVSVSKIRFLESQGLIEPDRSDSGYRQFDVQDVARLRFILQQQRDHFLPLKVIKSKLTLWERGEDVGLAAADPDSDQTSGEPLTREDILKRSGLDDDELDALVDAGVLYYITDSTLFESEMSNAAREAKRLLELGLEPRHLRVVRLSAGREADLIKQLTAPLMRAKNAESQARAQDLLDSSTGSIQALHRALLRADLTKNPGS